MVLLATIRVAIDNIQSKSADKKTLESFAEILRNNGHTVTTHGVGPNTIQGVMKKSSNSCDVMIQIAGGKCIGTAGDFYVGLQTQYYHAKSGGFAYFKCWDANWKARREPRDYFSNKPGTRVKREVDAVLGLTLPEVYKKWDNMYYGYGNSAEECAKTFLNNMSGNSSINSTQTNNGGSAIEYLKQVLSDLDPLGPQITLNGDTVNIKRSDPSNAPVLDESNIVKNSVSFTDYDSCTPNTYNEVTDKYLVNRFGAIPLELEMGDIQIPSGWNKQMLNMGQRGHGHSIELKCILNKNFIEGEWVLLSISSLGIKKPYLITKTSYDTEMIMGLTLEPGPPSVYTEQQETEEVVEDETTEET